MMSCKKCGELDQSLLQLHHFFPKYLGGTDRDGRVWLCKTCHKQIHLQISELSKKFLEGLR